MRVFLSPELHLRTVTVLSRHFVAVKSIRIRWNILYAVCVPRLWTETIAAHRAAVQDAVLDAVAALIAEHGLASVTMTEVAERSGIGRATLYKYFPDVEAVLVAWHQRQVSDHLAQLTQAAAGTPGPPGQRLQAVLE